MLLQVEGGGGGEVTLTRERILPSLIITFSSVLVFMYFCVHDYSKRLESSGEIQGTQ
jgi:hypothetical protein